MLIKARRLGRQLMVGLNEKIESDGAKRQRKRETMGKRKRREELDQAVGVKKDAVSVVVACSLLRVKAWATEGTEEIVPTLRHASQTAIRGLDKTDVFANLIARKALICWPSVREARLAFSSAHSVLLEHEGDRALEKVGSWQHSWAQR